MKLYSLRHKIRQHVTEEDAPYYGYGDYEKSLIVDEGFVFAPSPRKAGNWFKKNLAKAWNGNKPYLNGSSAVCTWWVHEMDEEEVQKLQNGMPLTFGKDYPPEGARISLRDWFSEAK